MKPLNLLGLIMAITLPVFTANAGTGERNSDSTRTVTTKNNSVNNAGKGAPKVCACQLLKVSSPNERNEFVAVFAEKTNYGNLDNSFSVAMDILEKEKKQMKQHFYSSIKLQKKITSYSSCKTLLGQLQVANGEIRVYDILNADILGNKDISK